MLDEVVSAYTEAIYDTDRDRALAIVRHAACNGLSPEDIVLKVVLPAMDRMVKAISEDFEATLAQHFMAAQIADTVTREMLNRFQVAPQTKGRIVIGAAWGDMHTLGKRIVTGCLRARMFEVHDLGVNVPPEKFVDEAVAFGAEVIGISALMVHTARGEKGCLRVRQLLRERGLEDQIKIVVGGAPFRFDPHLYQTVQADAWAEDAVTAGKVIETLLQQEVVQ